MYWLITAYDVLGELHIRARCVDDQDQDHTLEPAFHRASTIPLPRGSMTLRDVLVEIATELNDMAYYAEEDTTAGDHS